MGTTAVPMSIVNGNGKAEAEKKCGQCKYWNRIFNPHVLNSIEGECRQGPPQTTAIPQNGQLAFVTVYPRPDANFSACGKYESSIDLGTDRLATKG